ncbi:hypothetical protein PPERSA_01414 [Pseudocohnilembus persalinus]|uniref:Uncharacterized protein n=1 Tax=Pseudocohnilembus persalinus TaxID=266149 RepID=A0A0V0QH36_PSEPJ|nr:hypothetical protein PPERSA_01414 [Pseudocohnilembus persalinus]|eukprot:KRX01511.1 hypothetical protein PPERSA_01414 [Pseudocohnilembus persalinus]
MTTKQVPLKVPVQNFADVKIRRYGRKKKIRHSKNPYYVKPYIVPDYDKMPAKKLDGYLLLNVTKNDLPHEILKANLSKLRISETVVEDTKYFINLKDLDLSENFVRIEDLIYFQSLEDLKLCANQIEDLQLPENVFPALKNLDLSFNRLIPPAIEMLSVIENLKYLNLENNELRELPEDMSKFQSLEDLNLNNNFFESNSYAAQFWYSLSTIKKLKKLHISKNHLRGIHTAKLVAGNFQVLEYLDFSYNFVEDQHNLICARNFKNLKILIVTGNPFAILGKHLGLEMEFKARTGGDLINEKIQMSYLKKQKEQRPKIQYEKIRTVENDNFSRDKNYFMGIEMPKDLQIQDQDEEEEYEGEEIQEEDDDIPDQQVESQINERLIKKQMEQSDQEEEEEEEQAMFITEDPNQKGIKQKKQMQQQYQDYPSNTNSQSNINNNYNINQSSNQQSQQQINNISQAQQIQQQLKQLQQLQQQPEMIANPNMSHDQIMKIAQQSLADQKDYDQAYELQTAYKTLKNVAQKQDNFEFQDLEQPHYMKSTKAIKRLKQGGNLQNQDSIQTGGSIHNSNSKQN